MSVPSPTLAGPPTIVLPRYRPTQVEWTPPCTSGCPNGADVRQWVGIVAQRQKCGLSLDEALERAWRLLTEVNPFPAVLGRVCPHPCQDGCNRSEREGAVEVRALERYLGDWAIERELAFERPYPTGPISAGVIGAGPAGLSFAYQMARQGHRVTVYERRPRPGGVLRYGVPRHRLPLRVLEAEIERILDLGVELKTGTDVDKGDLDVLRLRHTVVFVGIGAQRALPLGIPGEEGRGVHRGLDFLSWAADGAAPSLGDEVVVLGGGNTAVDAARVARRSGSAVTLVYRRTRAEMPAIDEEVEAALADGVVLEFLGSPIAIHRQSGSVRGVEIGRNRLAATRGADGRRRVEAVPGAATVMPAEAAVVAVSQEPEWGVLEPTNASSAGRIDERTWAGGDVLGGGIAVGAVYAGRRAAEGALAELAGQEPPPPDARPRAQAAIIDMDFHPVHPPAPLARTAPGDEAEEDLLPLDEDTFLREAERCLSCGSCLGCQLCAMFCTADCFAPDPAPRPGSYFRLSLDRCLECGKCIEVCPTGHLQADEAFHPRHAAGPGESEPLSRASR